MGFTTGTLGVLSGSRVWVLHRCFEKPSRPKLFFFGLQGSKVGQALLIEPICWLSAMRNTPLSPGAKAEKFTVWFCCRIASRTLHKHCPDIGSMVMP